jgi:hypothetical protein
MQRIYRSHLRGRFFWAKRKLLAWTESGDENWRKRVGVEPTILAAKDRINGFEGHEGRLAGIKKITFHQLRHTFCSRLADAGVPLPVIQKLAGRASITMTSRYTHPADELKQSAVEVLLKGRKGLESATKSATESLLQRGRRLLLRQSRSGLTPFWKDRAKKVAQNCRTAAIRDLAVRAPKGAERAERLGA